MTDFPNPSVLPLTIHTASPWGPVPGARENGANSAGFASGAWTTANLAIAIPIFLPFRYPIRNFFVYNFATVNGSFDVGIYNRDNVLLVSTGSTVQAGASGLQFIAKEYMLDAGAYRLALSSSSTTATFAQGGWGTATRMRYLGIVQMASAFPLPATFVPAAMAQARYNAIGFTHVSGTPTF